MDNRPTLEEQLIIENIVYIGKIIRKISRERMIELYKGLDDDSIYVVPNAERLFAEIIEKEANGHFISRRSIREPENFSAFIYLIKSGLIEVQKQPYFFGLFKKHIVVAKDNDKKGCFE